MEFESWYIDKLEGKSGVNNGQTIVNMNSEKLIEGSLGDFCMYTGVTRKEV